MTIWPHAACYNSVIASMKLKRIMWCHFNGSSFTGQFTVKRLTQEKSEGDADTGLSLVGLCLQLKKQRT